MQAKYWKKFPEQRKINNPLMTFYTLESPWFHRPNGKWKLDLTGRFDNFFNLTMTYRLDSDVFSPYFTIYRLKLLAWCSQHNPELSWKEVLNKRCVLPKNDGILNKFYRKWVESTILNRERKRGVIGLISNCLALWRSSLAKDFNKKLNKIWVVPPNSDDTSPPIHSLEIYGKCASSIQPGRNHHNKHHQNNLEQCKKTS